MSYEVEVCLAFALGCVTDVARAEHLTLHLTSGRASETLIADEFPDLYARLVPLTRARVFRYWTETHMCVREKSPVRYARVAGFVTALPEFVRVTYAPAPTQVRALFVRNYRKLGLRNGDQVYVHGGALALHADEVPARTYDSWW